MMRITLKEPGLELQVNKVETTTGTGWRVTMPDDRKILVMFYDGRWETNDTISDQFVRAIGNEISRMLVADQPGKPSNNHSVSNPRRKRARILRYFLV